MKTDIKKLEKLLKLKTHNSIVSDLEKTAKDNYFVHTTKLFTIFVPITMQDDEIIPCVVSHTDTVSEKKPKKLSLSTDGVLTNPDGVLGADDRAGVYIIYEMLKRNVKAIFILTDLEECGGIGASACGEDLYFKTLAENNISALIELDRENKDHCATYGYDNPDLIKIFEEKGGYKEEYGSYTDVATLSQHCDIACVNLSVGYYRQHSRNEYLVIEELTGTLNFMIDMPKELYGTQYIIDDTYLGKYDNDWYNYGYSYGGSKRDDVASLKYEEVCCEICQEHDRLYKYEGVMICYDCLDWYADYDDKWEFASGM